MFMSFTDGYFSFSSRLGGDDRQQICETGFSQHSAGGLPVTVSSPALTHSSSYIKVYINVFVCILIDLFVHILLLVQPTKSIHE